MAYQVLARKWRPQTFAEVVGQEHISRTLKNAIVNNRIGHAYLFVGSRGIGKTTTARIFAKALNCPNNHDGEPCCKCESCLEVANGSSMDVIEIDGASHNKVEDIRDIRDNVQYAPSRGRYKIYIIDEVHMLTVQAWNALLKTLEEPPPHVKFLFATTEPHKVLPTIISRCQRFDLKRLSVPLIVSRLKQIATGENINIEDAALAAIARAADGGMRDAQSIFDQIIAFCGNDRNDLIHEQDVIDVFGLASGLELREIAAAIFSNNLNAALKVLQKLADSGRDLERLYADLIEYVRNIMVAGLCGNASDILEVSDTELTDMTNIGRALDPHLIQRVLQELLAQEWSFRAALNKRIYFEATLARVMLEAHSVQLDDVFAHLNRISGNLPQDSIPPRPQIVIPPPTIIAPVANTKENPKLQVPATTAPEPADDKTAKDSATTETTIKAAPVPVADATPEVSQAPEATPAPVAEVALASEATPVETVPAPAPAAEAVPEVSPAAPETTPDPAAEAAPVSEAAPVPAVVTAPVAAPVAAAVPEVSQAQEKTSAPVAEAAPAPETTPVPAAEAVQAPEANPAPAVETSPVQEPAAAPEASQLQVPVPEAVPAPAPEAAPAPAVETNPVSVQVDVPVAATEDALEMPVSNEEEEATDEACAPMIDINAQLMQASNIDIEDEADPALADTSENSVMASYTPAVIAGRLVNKLSEMGGEYAKLADLVGNLTPQTLGQYGLTFLCEQRMFSSEELDVLSKSETLTLLNQAYKSLHLSGSVKINYEQDEQHGERVRYKPASFLEMQRIRSDEFVMRANKILGTELTEARVPDKRQ